MHNTHTHIYVCVLCAYLLSNFKRFTQLGTKPQVYVCVCVCVYNQFIDQVGHQVVHQWSGRPGSIPGRFIPKISRMVPDTTLLSTQQYKVRIKGKEEQSREKE